jgi:hypothetical protein
MGDYPTWVTFRCSRRQRSGTYLLLAHEKLSKPFNIKSAGHGFIEKELRIELEGKGYFSADSTNCGKTSRKLKLNHHNSSTLPPNAFRRLLH